MTHAPWTVREQQARDPETLDAPHWDRRPVVAADVHVDEPVPERDVAVEQSELLVRRQLGQEAVHDRDREVAPTGVSPRTRERDRRAGGGDGILRHPAHNRDSPRRASVVRSASNCPSTTACSADGEGRSGTPSQVTEFAAFDREEGSLLDVAPAPLVGGGAIAGASGGAMEIAP